MTRTVMEQNRSGLYKRAMVWVLVLGTFLFILISGIWPSADARVRMAYRLFGLLAMIVGAGWLWGSGRTARHYGEASQLLAWCKWALPRATYERLVEPALGDLFEEHAQALGEGHRVRASWIIFSGYLGILRGLALAIPYSVVKGVWRIMKLWMG